MCLCLCVCVMVAGVVLQMARPLAVSRPKTAPLIPDLDAL